MRDDDFEPVEEEAAINAGVVAVLAAAGALWLLWIGWPWVLDYGDPDFNPLILLVTVLVGVTVWQGVLALRAFRRHRSFGAVALSLDPPGHLAPGRPLVGTLRSRHPVAARGAYRLVLTCHDVHAFSRGSDGPGQDLKAFPVWSQSIELPATHDAQDGLPFRFDPPAHVGPEPKARRLRAANPYFRFRMSIAIPGLRRVIARNQPPVDRYWTLTATAPTRSGPAFHCTIRVPLAP